MERLDAQRFALRLSVLCHEADLATETLTTEMSRGYPWKLGVDCQVNEDVVATGSLTYTRYVAVDHLDDERAS